MAPSQKLQVAIIINSVITITISINSSSKNDKINGARII